MPVSTLLFLALAAFGHVAFWVAVDNRWHATGLPRPLVKSVACLFFAGLVAPIAWAAWNVYQLGLPSLGDWAWEPTPATVYLTFAAAFGVWHLSAWLRWRWRTPPAGVDITPPRVVDIAEQLGGRPVRGLRATIFGLVPGNQLCKLHLARASLSVPGLAPELDGLSVCHWSDLHFSGRIDRGYFREVVRLSNDRPADVLALTGDICDVAHCIDWIPELLAGVEARLGKYFVLGNHDLRTRDIGRLRAAMGEAGFVDLGNRAVALDEGRIVIAGDERPWYPGEPQLPAGDAGRPVPLRILLAHTPDRLAWARSRQFHLMLAGHTHGGQIRFPLIGPVLCPSWHGTKYADGYYYEQPTLLHVSRGTASLFPLRWNCPPEITHLVLRGAS